MLAKAEKIVRVSARRDKRKLKWWQRKWNSLRVIYLLLRYILIYYRREREEERFSRLRFNLSNQCETRRSRWIEGFTEEFEWSQQQDEWNKYFYFAPFIRYCWLGCLRRTRFDRKPVRMFSPFPAISRIKMYSLRSWIYEYTSKWMNKLANQWKLKKSTWKQINEESGRRDWKDLSSTASARL